MSDQINKEYLAKRQLKRGSAGWILLAGLGCILRYLWRLRRLELWYR